MAHLPPDILDRLLRGRVPRHEIAAALGIETGVRAALQAAARAMSPPHVVERRDKGQPQKVNYHLRPVGAGEEDGRLVEVDGP